MASALREMLSDTSTLPLISIAVLTAAYSSYRANEPLLKHLRDASTSRNHRSATFPDQLVDDNIHVLQGSAALAFPLIATLSLTLLFFFLRSLGVIFTFLSTISGFIALIFVLWPLGHFVARRLPLPAHQRANVHTIATILTLPFAVTVVIAWLLTGHWLPNNLIGISLCILFASLCKVPNLKVTTILFIGLFFYDIFFVFFSERFFGRNVMVEVATTAPTNPASTIASWFHLPITPVKTLALPAKLIIPTSDGNYAILGLGDIILPVVLLVYLLQFDLVVPASPKLHTGYFVQALVAYAIALGFSFFCNYAFRSAQPALLYIVPALLGVALATAATRGQVRLLWQGPANMGGHEGDEGEDGVGRREAGAADGHPDGQNSSESYSLLDTRNSQTGPQTV